MSRFRQALIGSALLIALCLPLGFAQAQGGPPAGPPAAAQGRGDGPGMMGGYGYGPGMMGYDGRGAGMMGEGYGPGMMWGRGGPDRFGDAQSSEKFVAGQLAFLKVELSITQQQMPLWDKYAEAVQAGAKSMYERHKTLFDRDPTNETLTQRLDLREQLMFERLDTLRKTDAALKPLYAAFDDNQKKVADQFIGFPMGPFHGMF